MNQLQARQAIVDRLFIDLVGPVAADERIIDRPSDRYMTGILYPAQTETSAEDDDNLDGAPAEDEDAQDAATDVGVALVTTLKPSSAGLSFAIAAKGSLPKFRVRVQCGTYAREPSTAEDEKGPWRRAAQDESLVIDLNAGHKEYPLSDALRNLGVYVQSSPWRDDAHLVTVALVNRNRRGETRDESEVRTFFQVAMEISAEHGSTLIPRPSRRAETSDEDDQVASLIYRDAVELATGHTCAADWATSERGTTIKTAWLPTAVVAAVSDDGDAEMNRLAAKEGFDPLAAKWLAAACEKDLVQALSLLVDCYETWISARESDAKKLPNPAHRKQAETNLRVCADGAKRMRNGIALLRDKNVREAFQLAQRAMEMQRLWTVKESLRWRPFQLAFQLLTLHSVAERTSDERAVMDLLWFPTGGGKTEAYLGITAFLLFLRRLRATAPDSGDGVAVIMRYTLRLLTIQQFQRAAAMVTACEHIRRLEARQSSTRLGATPFSIGLWVGNAATPPTLQEARTGTGGATYKQLTTCPCCGAGINWSLRSKMEARCEGPPVTEPPTRCELGEVDPHIPIWTIDEEIYRERPSLVIGTVDKFAQIVRRAETGVLFGLDGDASPPDLIIQDELHLISGPLGSVTGLYETAVDLLCSTKGHRPKIIGSTATIRRAGDQIKRLFDRSTYQFPPPGIDANNSGFAVATDTRPGRLYLGVSTAGRSAKFAVQAVAAALLQAAQLAGSTDDVRDPYWTLVSYFNTLRELGGSLVLMQDDVPVAIEQLAARRGDAPRKINAPDELTSRVRSEEIKNMLDRLKRPVGRGALDVVLASNMISVGVDIPRLGLMMMVGQPKTIAEYIQATSRVGRGKVPGLVVCLYNAGRARDRSHFETFKTWHQTLYREVEATSVTPFASRAQDKALHAVLVALVRHRVAGMSQAPRLSGAALADAERIAELIEQRAARVEPEEQAAVQSKLHELLEAWAARQDVQKYWDDYRRQPSLLMSAEQYHAMKGSKEEEDRFAASAWPTPNSMREVEPGTPFVLVPMLAPLGADDAE